jgi:hypothetical protein
MQKEFIIIGIVVLCVALSHIKKKLILRELTGKVRYRKVPEKVEVIVQFEENKLTKWRQSTVYDRLILRLLNYM